MTEETKKVLCTACYGEGDATDHDGRSTECSQCKGTGFTMAVCNVLVDEDDDECASCQ